MSEKVTGTAYSPYVLGLADDALIYSHRLGEWLTWAPQLEEDMALANVSLDLIGQARALLTHVGSLDGTGRSEDDLAYLRDERDFRNVHLSAYQKALYAALGGSADEQLRAIAAKAHKEVRYHHDHAAQWVVRLGDGTQESHAKMQAALTWVAPYVDELFDDSAPGVAEALAAGVGVLPSSLRAAVSADVEAVVAEATLTMPAVPKWRARGGRDGVHSEPMGYLLAEMQHLPRW